MLFLLRLPIWSHRKTLLQKNERNKHKICWPESLFSEPFSSWYLSNLKNGFLGGVGGTSGSWSDGSTAHSLAQFVLRAILNSLNGILLVSAWRELHSLFLFSNFIEIIKWYNEIIAVLLYYLIIVFKNKTILLLCSLTNLYCLDFTLTSNYIFACTCIW